LIELGAAVADRINLAGKKQGALLASLAVRWRARLGLVVTPLQRQHVPAVAAKRSGKTMALANAGVYMRALLQAGT
jgi:hypothetical protein